jgi:hypothetical protein
MIDKLRLAVANLQHIEDERLRTHLEKEVLRWGVQVQRWKEEMEAKLEKQYDWLGPENRDKPNYEKRFTEWMTNLDEYKRACRLLTEAKALL